MKNSDSSFCKTLQYYISLIVHLGTIRVNKHLDALFFMCLFHFSTCFEQPSAHRQENKLYQYIIWYISLCVCGRLICKYLTCIPESHLHRVIFTRWCIDTIDSPDDEHWVARNMQGNEINTFKKCAKVVINMNNSSSIKLHEFQFNGVWVLIDEWTDGERDSTGARKEAKALKRLIFVLIIIHIRMFYTILRKTLISLYRTEWFSFLREIICLLWRRNSVLKSLLHELHAYKCYSI